MTEPMIRLENLRSLAGIITLCFLSASTTTPTRADEEDLPAGIPAPIALEQFDTLLQNPPFRRRLSLSESLILSGVASLPGGDVVTVLNRATDETFVVSGIPNAQGWKLIELVNSSDLAKVSARVSAGAQVVTLRFDPKRLVPEVIKSKAKPGAKSVDNTVVEALLRNIDTGSAGKFEELDAGRQEQFRTALSQFLNTYPEATDSQKVEFVRTTLSSLEKPDPDSSGAPSPE